MTLRRIRHHPNRFRHMRHTDIEGVATSDVTATIAVEQSEPEAVKKPPLKIVPKTKKVTGSRGKKPKSGLYV